MTPKRIHLKNFLSFGPAGTEFAFADGEPLWVLCGPNGVGKSAVFDAITYALYGQHRGGAAKAEQLVRHGANGFEIEFDFEFHGTDYRVRRTRPRRGRTTQNLLRLVDGEWTHVRGNDPAGAVTADDIKAWAADTLGLGYEAFTNSVLLRQGEADKLFTASKDDRIAVLKGIIGFEQYENLAGRVQTATAARRADSDALLRRMDAATPVTDDELTAAEAAVCAADEARALAHAARAAAVRVVEQAKQWDALEKRRADLDAKLAAADERQKNGRRIRDDKRTLDDLTAAVPVLEKLIAVRTRVERLGTEATDATAMYTSCAARRDVAAAAAVQAAGKAAAHRTTAATHLTRAKELAGEIERAEKSVAAAEEIAKLDAALARFLPDLDARLEVATADAGTTSRAERDAGTAKTRAESAVARARDDQKRFAGVEVGAVCSHCLQPVDEAHAAKERTRLSAELAAAEAEFARATSDVTQAAAAAKAATTTLADLTQQKGERDKLAAKRDAQRDALIGFGFTAAPADLRAALVERKAERVSAEQSARDEGTAATAAAAEAAQFESDRAANDTAATAADRTARAAETALASARAEEAATRDRLTPDWRDRLPNLAAAAVAGFAADAPARRLRRGGGVLRPHPGRRPPHRLAGRPRRREPRGRGRPEDARVPVADAARRRGGGRRPAHRGRRRVHGGGRPSGAARGADGAVHRWPSSATTGRRPSGTGSTKRLYDLVGPNGLQRELVRDAEEQILGFANETLQQLSDGDLALEEEADDESKKAFDLRVRRGGGEPIGVAFLSGSQRFRVAVSVALAVGRFASGRARPLESVIIDEGFGSLDRDGLRAMADELKRLQRSSSLRRVVLVSHQEEFTDQFPVGYRLTPTADGTAAHPFRR